MSNIHPSAIVSEEAEIAEDVSIGPFSVIDAGAKIAKGCKIGAHVWVTGHAVIGECNHFGYGSIIGADPQDVAFNPEVKSKVVIGRNNRIREYVTIHRSTVEDGVTSVGDSNFLMTGVHLAHDVQMGSYNNLANNVMLAGHVQMGNRIFLGGGSGFHQHIKIGDYAIVQGNAAISRDVPPYCMAHGRNELSGLNVVGLRRGGFTAADRADIKKAYNLLFRSSGNLSLSESLEASRLMTWTEAAEGLLSAAENASRKGILLRG